MNLYKISQNDNIGYDTYDSAIVAANDENEARSIHPSGESFYSSYTWASYFDNVQVELIGEAIEGTKAGVILASYNAG